MEPSNNKVPTKCFNKKKVFDLKFLIKRNCPTKTRSIKS